MLHFIIIYVYILYETIIIFKITYFLCYILCLINDEFFMFIICLHAGSRLELLESLFNMCTYKYRELNLCLFLFSFLHLYLKIIIINEKKVNTNH